MQDPGHPFAPLGMPPFLFAEAGDTVKIPIEFYAEVPADSQVTSVSLTVESRSPDFDLFGAIDTSLTALRGWTFVTTSGDDSLRIVATAPPGAFFHHPAGPPALLFTYFGEVLDSVSHEDSLELRLHDVSITVNGIATAIPDEDFPPTKIFIGEPPPPPPGAPVFAFFDTHARPDSNFTLDFAVVQPVPADSQLSRIRATVRAQPALLDWFPSGHELTPEISGWSLTVAVQGDSMTFDLEAPAGVVLEHPGFDPLVLVRFVGHVDASAPPEAVIDVKADNVILTVHGVDRPVEPSLIDMGTVFLGDGPGDPPGEGHELFTFAETHAGPDSTFGLDFLLVGEVPADSQLTKVRAVVRADPPLLDWLDGQHALAPELSGWAFIAVSDGASLTFELEAPAGTFIQHDGVEPLRLATFVGHVHPDAPTNGVIAVLPEEVVLTAHGAEMPVDPFMVGPGEILLGSGQIEPPPPPLPPPVTTEGRTNLGLYGGTVLDFAFDEVHGLVLAAVAAPQSVFFSADSGLTWAPAFPNDSLEFQTGFGIRGFGGRAMQVEASEGYCYSRTSQEAGTLTGTQVSEDGLNWRTLLDGYIAERLLRDRFGGSVQGPFAIRAMSTQGPVALVSTGNFVFRTTDAGRTWDISVVPDASALSSTKQVTALELRRDDPSGKRFYVTLSESWDQPGAEFYRTEDGVTFERIFVHDGADTAFVVKNIATLPSSGDTLWVAALDPARPSTNGLWRSFDAGDTWEKVFESANPDATPSATLYKDSNYPGPAHVRIFLVGENKYSDDLGDSWIDFAPQNDPHVERVSNANAAIGHIPDTDIYFSQADGAPARSTTGLEGPYLFVPTGLEGTEIWDIAQIPNDLDKVYVATSVGLAYTSVFTDTTITPTAKWAPPYGNYPINPSGGGNMGFTAIAIDPNNTAHIVAANGNGIFVSETGGFTNDAWSSIPYHNVSGLDEPTFKGNGGRVAQLTFITSDSIIAAAYCENVLYGALLLSTDGGYTWSTMPQAGNHNFKTVIAAWDAAQDSLVLFAGGGWVAHTGGPGGGSAQVDSGAVYKSLDRGATWTRVALAPHGTFNPAPFPLPVNDMAVKPGSLDTLYMACGENLSNAIVRTFDGGHTLESISLMAVGPREGAFEAVAINKNHPDSVYFAIRRDILVYDAVADTATTLFRGYPGELTHTLLYDELTMGSSAGFYALEAPDQKDIIASTDDSRPPVPSRIELSQNYPNPFNPATRIVFSLPQAGRVKLEIFNIRGRRVAELISEPMTAGKHEIDWRPENLASGTYFYRLHVTFASGREQMLTRKLLFIK